MEAMDVMRSYMTENGFPPRIFNSLDILHWTAQKQRSKLKKKEPSVYSLFNEKRRIKYTDITCK